jgi:mandelamide amidase
MDVASAISRAKDLARLNMFISLAERQTAEALATARKALPLAGMPIAIKDNIDVKGFTCTAGTPALRDWRPPTDASVVKHLIAAGAVVIGKTHLHELAAGVTSDNAAFGRVLNPYDPVVIAGGSSGGSAVAVASGVVPVALGTDTAGSCRVPASLSGCVGFKPTIGRYPSAGLIPLSLTRDAIGTFARDVAHVILVDCVLTGSAPAPTQSIAGKRLGIPRPYFYNNLDQDVRNTIDLALEKLAAGGAVLDRHRGTHRQDIATDHHVRSVA